MAYVSGTATNFLDLCEKLRDFLTANATLVAAGQQWSVLYGPASGPLSDNSELLLQGPGNSGTDEILVGLHLTVNSSSGYYNLGIAGYSTYNPDLPLASQANRLSPRYLHLWNNSMPYWFIANGRRFIVVVGVSTVYQSAYAGFILPYHLPTTWAYPLFVGGCSSQSSWLYSQSNHGGHSAFFNPGNFNNTLSVSNASAAIRLPDGQWVGLANKEQSGTSEQPQHVNNIAPWARYWAAVNLRQALDDLPVLTPSEIAISSPYGANLGSLEGVYHIPGFGIGSENIVTVGGVNHLVVQNVYRTANGEYAAIALE